MKKKTTAKGDGFRYDMMKPTMKKKGGKVKKGC